MIIREAKSTYDFEQIVDMARDMHAESPRFSRVPFEAEKVYALTRRLTEEDTGLVLVAEDEGVLVGMYAGFLAPYFFSYENYASDVALYVSPGQRGGPLAAQLIQAFVAWATEKGVRELAPGASTEVSTEAVRALYESQGFRVGGYLFLKDI